MISKQLIKDSPLAMYTCDATGRVTFFNTAAVELWGSTPEYWYSSWKLFHTNGQPMETESCPMAISLTHGVYYAGEELVVQRPDGSFRSVLVYITPLYSENKILLGTSNTLVDLTNKKSSDEKHAILSAIVESSDDAILSKSLQGVIKSWNRGAEKIFGYTEDEMIGEHISKIIPLALMSEEEVIISNIKAGKKVDHFQTIRMHKDGHELDISLTVSPIKDSFGNITGASKVARDITQIKKAERAALEFAKRQQLLNSIGTSISEKLDVKEILQRVTDATTAITGASFGAFFYNTYDDKGKPLMLFTHSGIPAEISKELEITYESSFLGAIFSDDYIVRLADVTKDPRYDAYQLGFGKLNVRSYLTIPVKSGAGGVIGGLFFGNPEVGVFKTEHEDILASIASQAAVALENSRLFEELTALSDKKDEFIALASHELKTPLTTLKGYLQMLQREEGSKVADFFVQKSMKQVDRLGSLINDLLDISKVEAGKLHFNFEYFDIRLALQDILETFYFNTTSHKISYEGHNDKLMVYGDQQRIEQVIINLLNNAIKYSPHSPQVHVKLETANGMTVIKVRDNGIGLSKQQQNEIFKRFFRADGVSDIAGLGLGLYISKEIIDRHKGSFDVTSEMGVGSEFSFTIPINPTKDEQ